MQRYLWSYNKRNVGCTGAKVTFMCKHNCKHECKIKSHLRTFIAGKESNLDSVGYKVEVINPIRTYLRHVNDFGCIMSKKKLSLRFYILFTLYKNKLLVYLKSRYVLHFPYSECLYIWFAFFCIDIILGYVL